MGLACSPPPHMDPRDSERFQACALSPLPGPRQHKGSLRHPPLPLLWARELQLDFSLNGLRTSQYEKLSAKFSMCQLRKRGEGGQK